MYKGWTKPPGEGKIYTQVAFEVRGLPSHSTGGMVAAGQWYD